MNAAEVLAQHQGPVMVRMTSAECFCGVVYQGATGKAEQHAAHQLDALKAAGFAVVELEDIDELRHGWCLEVDAKGFIHDHGPLDRYSAEDARGFAAALLAAADAAEATS